MLSNLFFTHTACRISSISTKHNILWNLFYTHTDCRISSISMYGIKQTYCGITSIPTQTVESLPYLCTVRLGNCGISSIPTQTISNLFRIYGSKHNILWNLFYTRTDCRILQYTNTTCCGLTHTPMYPRHFL
jgi:hypothetical protein